MDGYKHIEHSCGAFIASHYKNPVEIGVGNNPDAARCIHETGCPIRAIDMRLFLLLRLLTAISSFTTLVLNPMAMEGVLLTVGFRFTIITGESRYPLKKVLTD
jgi:hypothetical protein